MVYTLATIWLINISAFAASQPPQCPSFKSTLPKGTKMVWAPSACEIQDDLPKKDQTCFQSCTYRLTPIEKLKGIDTATVIPIPVKQRPLKVGDLVIAQIDDIVQYALVNDATPKKPRARGLRHFRTSQAYQNPDTALITYQLIDTPQTPGAPIFYVGNPGYMTDAMMLAQNKTSFLLLKHGRLLSAAKDAVMISPLHQPRLFTQEMNLYNGMRFVPTKVKEGLAAIGRKGAMGFFGLMPNKEKFKKQWKLAQNKGAAVVMAKKRAEEDTRNAIALAYLKSWKGKAIQVNKPNLELSYCYDIKEQDKDCRRSIRSKGQKKFGDIKKGQCKLKLISKYKLRITMILEGKRTDEFIISKPELTGKEKAIKETENGDSLIPVDLKSCF